MVKLCSLQTVQLKFCYVELQYTDRLQAHIFICDQRTCAPHHSHLSRQSPANTSFHWCCVHTC